MAADVKCNDKAGAVIAQSQSQDSYGTRSLYARFMQRASAALMCAQGIFACVHSGATGRHMGAVGAVDIIEELDHRGTRPITKRQASHINPPHADASNPLSLRQSASSLPFPSLPSLLCFVSLQPHCRFPCRQTTSVLSRRASLRRGGIYMLLLKGRAELIFP